MRLILIDKVFQNNQSQSKVWVTLISLGEKSVVRREKKKGLVGKGLTGLVPRGRESKANDTCYEQVAQAAAVCKPCVSH